MKDKSILEETIKEADKVSFKDSGNHEFVVEYRSGCAECTMAIEEINFSEAQKTDEISSVENKLFICLCDEIKIDES